MKKKSHCLGLAAVLLTAALGGMLFSSMIYAATGTEGRKDQSAPKKVGVITLHKATVPRIVTLPGRAVAFEQVDIRPRVSGVISKILYTPGEKLEVGTPLFQLDDASYVAAVAAAEADAVKAKANLPIAQAAYDRAKKLEGSGYTEAQVETAKSGLADAQATLKAAEAALTYARIERSWTTVSSPIQGYAEVTNVSVGDLVTSAQSDSLTTVTRLDPIDVDVLETSTRILSVRDQIEQGILQPSEKMKANLLLENGDTYQGVGTSVAPSKTVSTSTGTISIRFRFENPDQKILPGMFLRGTVELGTIHVFLLPQQAATMQNDGFLKAFLVGKDGKSTQVSLKTLGSYKNSWMVVDGVSEGDQLIVDALKNMRAGAAVSPVEAVIDDNGVVQDAEGK